ncbi:MAG TPA: hypothetical protein VHW74_16715 [Mycobacteriales bacterium]|jgi:hypothetical protein|nr:hypothetical protein [Mycobacteriales bacterium]
MSDTSILPGSQQPPAGNEVPYPDFDEPGDDRRRLFVIGGILALVLILIVGFLLLHGGGSSGSETFRPPAAVIPSSTPAATPAPGTSPGAASGGKTVPGTKLPKKTHVVIARDPFKALIVAPTTGTNIGTATVGGSSAPGGFSFPSGGASGGGTPAQVPASDGPPIWIELVKVNGASDAVFAVGYAHGKKFEFDVTAPAAASVQGTVFDEEFALLGIQDGGVTVQVGDATPFDLRPGVSHPV